MGLSTNYRNSNSKSNRSSNIKQPAQVEPDEKDLEETLQGSFSHNTCTDTTVNVRPTYTYLLPCEADWPYVWAIRDGAYLDCFRYVRHMGHEAQADLILRHMALPVEIIPGKLYLGDADSLHNLDRLRHLKITGVLNMASNSKCFGKTKTERMLTKEGITYRGIPAEDQFAYPLLHHHLEQALEILEELLEGHGSAVVVNCVMGCNRSVLIVAAYYMLTTQTPVLETMKYLRCQRGNRALTNEGFQEQLVALARRHKLLGLPPGTYGSLVPDKAPKRTLDWWTTTETCDTKPNVPIISLWKRFSNNMGAVSTSKF